MRRKRALLPQMALSLSKPDEAYTMKRCLNLVFLCFVFCFFLLLLNATKDIHFGRGGQNLCL